MKIRRRLLPLLWTFALLLRAQPDPSSLLSQALTLARAGNLSQAQTVLQNGRVAFPADPRFLLELAGLAYTQKDYDQATTYLRAALRLDPSDAYGNSFLAGIYLLQGNLEAALLHWNRVSQPVLSEVRLLPQPPLSDLLLQRAVTFSAGQILTLRRLRTTAANLDRLDVFSQYHFDLAPSTSERYSLTLRLLDAPDLVHGWLGRLLPLARALPYRTLTFDRFNIGRNALNLTTLWRWDPNKYRAAVSLSGPFQQNPRYVYRLFADARRERWNLAPAGPSSLILRRVEAGADLRIGLNGRLEWTPGVRLARGTHSYSDGTPLYANYWSLAARNQLDYLLASWPEQRVRLDAAATLETGTVRGIETSRFATVTADWRARWIPAPRHALTVLGRVRAGKTFGALPFDQLFQLGMERDNDLWLRGHVATRDGEKGNAPMGRKYSLLQTGVQRDLFRLPLVQIAAGPFFDSGWIADPSHRFGSQGWMYDTGVQATVSTALGFRWTLVYGRDLRGGRGVFYTGVSRVKPLAPPQ